MNRELRKIIDIIVLECFPEQIILFGSRSGKRFSKTSDYDIFVIVKKAKNPRDIERKLYVQLYKKGISQSVDLLVDTVDHFAASKDNPYMIYNQVYKKGKVLYEKKAITQAMA